MECHACGIQVIEGQKFCQECGESLRGVTEPTERIDDVVAAAAAGAGDVDRPERSELPTQEIDPRPPLPDPTWSAADAAASVVGPSTADADVAPDADVASDAHVASVADPAGGSPDTTPAAGAGGSPDYGGSPESFDDPAMPTIANPMPAGGVTIEPADEPFAAAASAASVGDATDPGDERAAAVAPSAASVGDPTATASAGAAALDATLADLGATPPAGDGSAAGEPTPVGGVDRAVDTDEIALAAVATTVLAATAPTTTDEYPAVFDGSDDVRQFPPGREPFKLRVMFVLGFFGAIVTLMATAADLTDIRTSTPVDGISIGISTLADVGVNLPVAGIIGGAVMTIGGLLACFGFRWGAGLAGGGGLAVAGWAGLTIGLAETPIAVAQSITRTTTTQQFTLTVTRDLGYWLVIAAGAIGLVVFVASLRLAGTGGQRSLNPWVAAVGAVSALILAVGPLIPEGSASFSDNFRSPNALIDLPTAYFGGRLGQVALIGFAGVVGFLLVRAYGLGLAAGGISVAVWLWLSALLGIGENLSTGEQPLGIAAGNFGAGDTTPHGVTTVGMALTLLMLTVAAVLATVQHRRDLRGY